MKRFFFSQVLLLFLSTCFSQDNVEVPKFGKVDIADLQMKDCSYEPGA